MVKNEMFVITSIRAPIPAKNIFLLCVGFLSLLVQVRLTGDSGLAWLICACQLITICRVPLNFEQMTTGLARSVP